MAANQAPPEAFVRLDIPAPRSHAVAVDASQPQAVPGDAVSSGALTANVPPDPESQR